jgi:hypothetical protein
MSRQPLWRCVLSLGARHFHYSGDGSWQRDPGIHRSCNERTCDRRSVQRPNRLSPSADTTWNSWILLCDGPRSNDPAGGRWQRDMHGFQWPLHRQRYTSGADRRRPSAGGVCRTSFRIPRRVSGQYHSSRERADGQQCFAGRQVRRRIGDKQHGYDCCSISQCDIRFATT